MKFMKTIAKLPIPILLIIVTFIFLGNSTSDADINNDSEANGIVVLEFKAQPDKGVEAAAQLTELLRNVRQEPHFVKITMHVDPKDNTNIMLYEEWENMEYYNSDHMSTPHINKFMADSRNFLVGPPDITQWQIRQVIEKEE